MDKYFKQFETALEIYQSRGEQVISALKLGDWDQCVEALRLRKAAFLNYKTAEALTSANISKFYQSNHGEDLWKKLTIQESTIIKLLEELRLNYQQQIKKLSHEKTTISRYRSKKKTNGNFQRSI